MSPTYLGAVYESSSSEVPVDVAYGGSNCVQCKPKHQILGAVPSVNGDHLPDLYTQVVHEPIAHSGDCLEELFVRPCIAFEDQKWVIRSIAQSLVFQNVVCEDSSLDYPFGNEVEDIL